MTPAESQHAAGILADVRALGEALGVDYGTADVDDPLAPSTLSQEEIGALLSVMCACRRYRVDDGEPLHEWAKARLGLAWCQRHLDVVKEGAD